MGGVEGSPPSLSLQETPSWALATVCFFFIFLGIGIEHLIHLTCHWLKKHKKNALLEAVEKLKTVLMLLGFISLILAVTQRYLSKICVPHSAANFMLPCRKIAYTKSPEHQWAFENHPPKRDYEDAFRHGRLLLAADEDAPSSTYHCASKRLHQLRDATDGMIKNSRKEGFFLFFKFLIPAVGYITWLVQPGMESFISIKGVTELNAFIFVLAVMQIVYSVLTMTLGRAKMKRWKQWEKETQTVEYMAANDPERFRFTRQTTFARRHMSACTQTSPQLWIKCLFRQFFRSVAKVDYLTLRHGFISAHISNTNSTFNFRKYIQRSLEDDFKTVVGISSFMWFVVVIFLLVDVHGWNMYLWISFLPLIMVLAIGTKLEMIVANMALKLQDQNSIVIGAPVVEPNDRLFWFNQPQFVLTLLHFTLFMNAFEFAFFIWVTLQFGIKSCYHERAEIIVIRVVLAVMVQVLCSYITLPLYALVTQMGSKFKSAVLEENTVHALKEWHADVRRKRNKKQPNSSSNSKSNNTNNNYSDYSPTTMSLSTTPNHSRLNSRSGKEIIEEDPNQEPGKQAKHGDEDDIVETSVVSPGDGHVEIQVSEGRRTSPQRS